jgi:4-hydroxy-tetrahydrodipicolinate synthase
VLAGEDAWITDALHAGAVGVIGVAANVAPALVAELVHGVLAGSEIRAPALAERLAPLVAALFAETNPAPLKAALALLGRAREELRLPLVPVEEGTRETLRAALEHARIPLEPGAR